MNRCHQIQYLFQLKKNIKKNFPIESISLYFDFFYSKKLLFFDIKDAMKLFKRKINTN